MEHGPAHSPRLVAGRAVPLTVEKVHAAGATLRAEGYRSHKNYLSRLYSEAQRGGAIESPLAVARAIKDANRACARGLVGPRKRVCLSLAQLPLLPASPAPWAVDGPLWPRDTLVLGSWWQLRELELAGAFTHHLSFSRGENGLAEVARLLPASKTDPRAIRGLKDPWMRMRDMHLGTTEPPNQRLQRGRGQPGPYAQLE